MSTQPPATAGKSTLQKITLASVIMMASVFLSRVMGLLREMVIAHMGGTSQEIDIYQIAFIIPEILNHVVASGFLSITFIPIFTTYLAKNDEAEGWRLFSAIFNVFSLVLIVFVAGAMLFVEDLTPYFAPGIHDQAALAQIARMTRIILPAQLFFFGGGLLMAVQYSKERFFLPALAPLIYNFGIILGGLILAPLIGIEGLSWGVLLGAFFGNFLIQWLGARKIGLCWSPCFNIWQPDFRVYVYLSLPLVIGIGMTFSVEIFFKIFGSFLPVGTIAALNYGIRLMFILIGVFGQAIGIASYPYLAQLVAKSKLTEVVRLVDQTLLRSLSLVIPISVLFIILRVEIVTLLFQRGHFDLKATMITANGLKFLLIGTFAFTCQTIVLRAFYSMKRMVLPTVITTGAAILSLPIYWYGAAHFGLEGIAGAISASAILQFLLLYAIWSNSLNHSHWTVSKFLLKIISLSILVGLLIGFTKYYLFPSTARPFIPTLLVCLITSICYLTAIAGLAHLFKIQEVVSVFQLLWDKGRRLRRRPQ